MRAAWDVLVSTVPASALPAWALWAWLLWERHVTWPFLLFRLAWDARQARCACRRPPLREWVAARAIGEAEPVVLAPDAWAAAAPTSAPVPAKAHARIAVTLRSSARRWLTPPLSEGIGASLSGYAPFGRRRGFTPERAHGFILSAMVATYA